MYPRHHAAHRAIAVGAGRAAHDGGLIGSPILDWRGTPRSWEEAPPLARRQPHCPPPTKCAPLDDSGAAPYERMIFDSKET